MASKIIRYGNGEWALAGKVTPYDNGALASALKTIRYGNEQLILAHKITPYANGNLNLTLNTDNGIGIVGNGNDKITLTGNNNILAVGNGKNTLSVSGNNNHLIVGNGNNSVALGGNNETLFIGNGNNLINALSSSGKDVITAGNGNNTLNLGYTHVANSMVQLSAANFKLTLGHGINSVQSLTTGSTVITLGNKINSVDAGVGSSVITGGNGADKMTYEANLNAIAHGGASAYSGGNGVDLLELKVSYGQLNSTDFKNDVLGFKAAVASGAEAKSFFKFSAIPLSVKGFEQIKVVAQDLGAPKISFTPTSVRESTAGAKLGTLSATDIDAKDQHYWLIMNNSANGSLKYVVGNESTQVINGLTWFNGVNGPETLKLAAGVALDDSTPGMLPITVAVADIAQLQAIKAGTLQVSALPTHSYNVPVIAVPVPPASLRVTSPGGDENTSIPLNISATTRYAGDVLTYKFTGVPAGGSLSAGTLNQDGSWTLTAAQIVGLTFKSGLNQVSGSVTLNVIATSTSPNGLSASINQSIKVGVNPVADVPVLGTQVVSGNEGSAIPLNISAALPVGNTTDVLSVKIGNVPTGATLSSGGTTLAPNTDGTYTVSANQLSDLAITVNDQLASATNLALAITAYSSIGNSVATATATQMVTVNPVADVPVLGTQVVSGNEGSAIPLNISAALPVGNTTDVLSVTIGNVPDSAMLSSGGTALVANADGTYTVSASQLQDLAIMVSGNLTVSTNLELAIKVYSTVEESVATATATQLVTINPTITIDPGSLSSASDGTTAAGTGGPTLTLADGETLALTNGSILTGADSTTLTLADGSNVTLTVTGGSMTVTAVDGSTMTLVGGSTVTVAGGSTVTVEDGSTVTVVDGSTTAVVGGSTLTGTDGSTTTVVGGSTLTGTDGSTATVVGGSTLIGTDGSTATVVDSSLAYADAGSGHGAVLVDRIIETVDPTSYTYAIDPALQGTLDSAASVPTIDLTPQDSILDVSAQSVLSVVASDGSSTATALDSSTVAALDSSTVAALDSPTVAALALDSSTATVADSLTVTAVDSTTTSAISSIATADSSIAIVSGQTDATLSLQATFTDLGISGVEINQTMI
ncbi:beta strand repeat-containing protein [Legionella longbeachae]|uniref:beta strand repeat-containing protein n=1 Tax=Legionella longbeachae TaxID=450 RepID=UPI000F709FD8|nr:hypothetical protein [Legionella longbeachae]VEE02766.1 Uncharacterised protein [Legionella oakridgensis]HBD7397949.1 hypothetical protein [Legionella pneumophila]ARM32589.2 hypothetical protein B0B39_03215 [Legionella longbeachae]QIN32518.1 hypothetical protein GCB94_10370 [Legionella longbeachae]RZV21066.1 hypothetical protein EKG34_17520 [Legionella longbeachae]